MQPLISGPLLPGLLGCLFLKSERLTLGLYSRQQSLGRVFASDQLWVGGAPVGGQFTPEGLGQYRLSQVIHPLQCRSGFLFDGVGEGKEFFDAADDFGLFIFRR